MLLWFPVMLATAILWYFVVIFPGSAFRGIVLHAEDEVIIAWERRAWWWYLGIVAVPVTCWLLFVELQILWTQFLSLFAH